MARANVFKQAISAICDIAQLKIGLYLLAAIILVAIFAPFLAKYDPYSLIGPLLAPPCAQYPLGTDGLGRDVYSMIVFGARISLAVGLIASSISGVVGTLLGGVAGFFGGRKDQVLSETVNIFLMIPTFFLVLIIVALFGSNIFYLMLIIGLTSWPGNARLMRAQALSIKERTFIKSLSAIGEKKLHILFFHIIPNGIFPIISNTTMNVCGAILTEATLSYLGLGDPNVVSWGQIVYNGRSYLVNGWWICTFGGMAIFLTVLAFYLIGDGLNRALSPRLRDLH